MAARGRWTLPNRSERGSSEPAPVMTSMERQHAEMLEVPNGYCPIHATGVKRPEGFTVTPLQYVD